MKWKARIDPPPPTVGQRRERIIFALVPHLCTDDHFRWLERIVRAETFDSDDPVVLPDRFGARSFDTNSKPSPRWRVVGYRALPPKPVRRGWCKP